MLKTYFTLVKKGFDVDFIRDGEQSTYMKERFTFNTLTVGSFLRDNCFNL